MGQTLSWVGQRSNRGSPGARVLGLPSGCPEGCRGVSRNATVQAAPGIVSQWTHEKNVLAVSISQGAIRRASRGRVFSGQSVTGLVVGDRGRFAGRGSKLKARR